MHRGRRQRRRAAARSFSWAARRTQRPRHARTCRALSTWPALLRRRADRGHRSGRAAGQPPADPHAAQRQPHRGQRHAVLRRAERLRGRALRARAHQSTARPTDLVTTTTDVHWHADDHALVRLVGTGGARRWRRHRRRGSGCGAGAGDGGVGPAVRSARAHPPGHRRARARVAVAALHLSPGQRGRAGASRAGSSSRTSAAPRSRRCRPTMRQPVTEELQDQLRRSPSRDFHIDAGATQRVVQARSRSRMADADAADRRQLDRLLRLRSGARPRRAAVPVNGEVPTPSTLESTRSRRAATRPGASAAAKEAEPRRRRRTRGVRAAGARPASACASQLVREKERVAWGELVAVERPGPDRDRAAVPAVWSLWRLPVAARHAGGAASRQEDHRPARARPDQPGRRCHRAAGDRRGPPFGYRDRARLAVGEGSAPRPVGFRARRSHDDRGRAPLSAAVAARWTRALPAVRALAARLPAGAEVDLQAGERGRARQRRTQVDATGRRARAP